MPNDRGDRVDRGSHPKHVLVGDDLVLACLDGTVVSPEIDGPFPILPGTMLALALESARSAGIPVECRPFSVPELHEADEIAITSTRRIHSITAIDGRPLRGGPVFGHLFDRMVASIASAIAGEPTAAAR